MTALIPAHALVSTRAFALTLAVALTAAAPAAADWLVLKDGQRLRGIEPRRQPDGDYLFTLEDGKVVAAKADDVEGVEKSPAGETVEHRGVKMPLRQKVTAAQRETKEREARAFREVEAEAHAVAAADAEAARARLEALDPSERLAVFAAALRRGSEKARLLAVRRIASTKEAPAVKPLVAGAMVDRSPAVRDACLQGLKAAVLEREKVGEAFIPYLRSPSSAARANASVALSVFPTTAAIPLLIEGLAAPGAYGGDTGGRAYVFQGTQRAYIRDYELVSGGTGFSIIEVADPVVDTMTTGVVLDVQANYITEVRSRAEALHAITGRDFGADAKRWKSWWATEGSRTAK